MVTVNTSDPHAANAYCSDACRHGHHSDCKVKCAYCSKWCECRCHEEKRRRDTVKQMTEYITIAAEKGNKPLWEIFKETLEVFGEA